MQILVVDDKQIILDSLDELLTTHGYLVDTACNGLAASEKLQNSGYDLFIVDHLMPVMNGIQLTKQIRQHDIYANTPVIFMTTQGKSLVESLGDSQLFSTIIDKPIDEENLLKSINALLTSNTRCQSL
tara:strand:+ start:393 stop:776 length:384 start_codon:yes stop_codon:yes gene_type:complete